jgi:hypothetical protein
MGERGSSNSVLLKIGQKESVDSNDEIGCVAAWLQVWLTPGEGLS